MRTNEQYHEKTNDLRQRIEQAIRPIIEEYEEKDGIVVENIRPAYHDVTKISDASKRYALVRVKVKDVYAEQMGGDLV